MPSPLPPPTPDTPNPLGPADVTPPVDSPPLLPPNPLSTPDKVLPPPMMRHLTAAAARQRRRTISRLRKIFYLALLVVIAALLWFHHRVGTGGFFLTEGQVDLGALKSYATGPAEIYLVPSLPDFVRTRMNQQLNGYFDAIDHASRPPLGPSTIIPAPPTQLGARLLAQLPTPLYGVASADHVQFLINPLPVDASFRQPGAPSDLYFMEPLAYTRYRNALAYLTPENYPQQLLALRSAVVTDLALLDEQLKIIPPSTETYFITLLDFNWLGALLVTLEKLPTTAAPLLNGDTATLATSGPPVISFQPANLDAQLADISIGSGVLATNGDFSIQGAGTPVLRVPVADGQTLYFVSPTPLRGIGVTQLSSRLNFDPVYLFRHLDPRSPALHQPASSAR